jgi:hypothetical protein
VKTPLAILSEIGVPNLLAGGNAVQVYGFSRYTKDFDCVVSTEQAGAMKIALEAAGFEAFDDNHLVARYRHRDNPAWILDTIFVNAETFAKMWAGRRTVKAGTLTLTVAAPLHLVGMKLHAMKGAPGRQLHDVLDVMELLKYDRGNWTLDEVKALCERYGPAGIFETILPHLNP